MLGWPSHPIDGVGVTFYYYLITHNNFELKLCSKLMKKTTTASKILCFFDNTTCQLDTFLFMYINKRGNCVQLLGSFKFLIIIIITNGSISIL